MQAELGRWGKCKRKRNGQCSRRGGSGAPTRCKAALRACVQGRPKYLLRQGVANPVKEAMRDCFKVFNRCRKK